MGRTFVNSSRIESNDIAAGVGHGGCFGVDGRRCLWGAGGDVCWCLSVLLCLSRYAVAWVRVARWVSCSLSSESLALRVEMGRPNIQTTF